MFGIRISGSTIRSNVMTYTIQNYTLKKESEVYYRGDMKEDTKPNFTLNTSLVAEWATLIK